MLRTQSEVFDSLCDQPGCRLLVRHQVHATPGDFGDGKTFQGDCEWGWPAQIQATRTSCIPVSFRLSIEIPRFCDRLRSPVGAPRRQCEFIGSRAQHTADELEHRQVTELHEEMHREITEDFCNR